MKDSSGLASEMTYRDWLIGEAAPRLLVQEQERYRQGVANHITQDQGYKNTPSFHGLAKVAAREAELLAEVILEQRTRDKGEAGS